MSENETVMLKKEDFQEHRSLALAGYVIGQEISKEDYNRVIAEGNDDAEVESPTAEAQEAADRHEREADGEESPTKAVEEAAKEEDAKHEGEPGYASKEEQRQDNQNL